MSLSDVPVLSLLAVLVFIYGAYKIRKLINFFHDRRIPHVPLRSPFGSDWRTGLMQEHYGLGWTKIYQQLAPHKIGGYYMHMKPIVMVRDPEYVHRVYVSDFSHFVDHGFTVDEEKDPLDGHLFFIEGEKWKFLRSKLSPVFSSGKLRWMFEQMKGSSDRFVDNFERNVALGEDVDLKEDYARLTTDLITSCAFGIESNAMGDPDSRFRDMGKKFFQPKLAEVTKFIARYTMPELLIWLKIRTTSAEITDFFMDVVKQAFNHRLSTGFVRKDFVQLLLELREKGFVKSGESSAESPKLDKENDASNGQAPKDVFNIDDRSLTAQLFVFFTAGFETTSSTLYHLTYFLSRNKLCQDKAREEAMKVFEKNAGTWTYDCLKDLTYLDQCICETLRLLPALPMNFRICGKDYSFPDGTRIEKGTAVMLPTVSLHYDPLYFPEPKKFKPERFAAPPVKGSYAPFGDGPRMCIGKRFAEVEVKLTMAKLLCKYSFESASTDTNSMDWNPHSFIIAVKNPCLVRVEKRKP